MLNYFSGGRNIQDLAELRIIKTSETSIASKRGIHPKKIPPTADAAFLHSYRVYLEVVYWKTLMRTDIDATSWGWRVKDENLEPIMMRNVSQTNMFDILNKFPMSINFLIHSHFSSFSEGATWAPFLPITQYFLFLKHSFKCW